MNDIVLAHEEWGIDFEAEVAVITDDMPMDSTPDEAFLHIKLLMLANDVSPRKLIPAELVKGFGFVKSKPATSFAPVAVTADELGDAWRDGKVHLPLRSSWNGRLVGQPDAGSDMVFNFPQLVAHLCKTATHVPAPSSAQARCRTRMPRASIPASPGSAAWR